MAELPAEVTNAVRSVETKLPAKALDATQRAMPSFEHVEIMLRELMKEVILQVSAAVEPKTSMTPPHSF